MEFNVDMSIAHAYEEFGVFDYLKYRAGQMERLWRGFRPIAIMNAIVATLKNVPVSVFHLIPDCIDSIMS
jgi:hypothetical protein